MEYKEINEITFVKIEMKMEELSFNLIHQENYCPLGRIKLSNS